MVGLVSIAMFIVLLFTAVVLIWNTIRTGHVRPKTRDRGHEARRRDELVHPDPVHVRGAACTAWPEGCWRWPGLYGVNYLWKDRVIPKIPDLAALQVSSSQFNLVVILVLVVGMLVGAIGSAVAASRFLDV
jgi:hypothetical protein